MAVSRVVAADEVRQILETHGLLLQRVVDVGAVVVVPDLLSPGIRTGLTVIEEDYVGLDSLCVEDAGGLSKVVMPSDMWFAQVCINSRRSSIRSLEA